MRNAAPGQITDFGHGLMAAGLSAQKAGDYIDDVQATTLYNSYNEQVTKREQAYQLLQGKEAMDAFPKATAELEALRQSFEQGIESEHQRKLFASRADVRDAHSRVMVGAHGAQQTKIAKIGSLEAEGEGSFLNYQKTLEFARTLGNEDARAEQEQIANAYREAGLRQKQQAAEMRGETPEMIAARRVEELNKLHDGAIDVLLDHQDPQGARTYLNEHKNEMVPATIARREKDLAHADVQDSATKFMFAAEDQAKAQGGTAAEQEVYARSLADKAYREGTISAQQYAASVNMLKSRFTMLRNEEAARKNDAVIEAEKFLLDPANRNKGVADLDPRIIRTLNDTGMMDHIVKVADSGRGNDPEAWNAVMTMTDEQHRAMPDQEYNSLVLRLSPAQRTVAQNVRKAAIGTADERAKAAAGVSQEVETRVYGRRILKAQLTGHADHDNPILDDFAVRVGNAWTERVAQKKINPNDRLAFTAFLKEQEAASVDTTSDKVNPYTLDVNDAAKLRADPFIRFQNTKVRASELPIQITVTNTEGKSFTLSKAFLEKDLALALGRDPTPQELANYIDVRIHKSATPANIMLPNQPRVLFPEDEKLMRVR